MAHDRKTRIFLSSPSQALMKHREAAIVALRNMGYDVETMEDWAADGVSATAASLKHLRNSDLVVLLIARHLGHRPDDGGGRSITQLEYDYATDPGHPIDVRAFFLADGVADWPESDGDEGRAVADWKLAIRDRCVWDTFDRDPASLIQPLSAAVARWSEERQQRDHLKQYLNNLVAAYRLLDIVSVPQYADFADPALEHLYVEQDVHTSELSPDNADRWPTTETALEVFMNCPRLVVLGDPGGGKTSLVKWVTWQFAADALGPQRRQWPFLLRNDPKKLLLPLPFILRDLKIHPKLRWEDLWHAFRQLPESKPLAGVHLDPILDEGRALFLLDGLDEVSDLASRQALRSAVMDGIAKHPKCRWLLTSRIVGYEAVPFHAPDGSQYRLETARTETPGIKRYYLTPFDDRRIRQFAQNWYSIRSLPGRDPQKQADDLVAAVSRNAGTKSLARIPFLLTLMAVVHRTDVTLPDGRALLYEKITTAYVESREAHKGLLSPEYPPAVLRSCLLRVGIEMQRRRVAQQQDDATALLAGEADLLQWLTAALDDQAAAERFLGHLTHRTGLLLQRGSGQYAFMHLSFQEYFAAGHLKQQLVSPNWIRGQWREVEPEARPDGLRRCAADPRWRESLVFLCEMLANPEHSQLLRKDLLPTLFGKDFAGSAARPSLWVRLTSWLGRQAPKPDATSSNLLLARLVVNPHAGWNLRDGWNDPRRQQALAACCRAAAEIDGHDLEAFWSRESHILGVLFTAEVTHHSTILATLAEQGRAARPSILNLDGVGVTDIDPLGKLTALQVLSLSETEVTDFRPLESLKELRTLYLFRTRIAHLKPLEGLVQLRILNLSETNVTDLEPLRRLDRLNNLEFAGAAVSDLTPLEKLTNLEKLDFSNTVVSDLTPLQNLQGLRGLKLRGTHVTDIKPLHWLRKLYILNMDNTAVVDLKPLEMLDELEMLSLSETHVTDLQPLKRLTRLTHLYLRKLRVTDLSALENHTALEHLELDGTLVQDVRPLVGMKRLKILSLFDTPVAEEQIEWLRRALPECSIYYLFAIDR